MTAIVAAVTAGQISPDEAAELSRLIESFVKVFEVSDLERRLLALENAAVAAPARQSPLALRLPHY
jgi:hypothetical protein